MAEEKEKKPKWGKQQAYLAGLTENQKKLYDIFFWATPVNLQEPDARELKERIEQYRSVCQELNIVPTWSDLAVALQHPRPVLTMYREGARKCPQEIRDTLKRTSLWMEAALSQVGFNNPMYSTYVIWLQKNYFGFRDNIDINVNQNALPDSQSAADVMQKYKFIEASVVTPELEDKHSAQVVENALQGTVKDVVEVAEEEPKKKRGRPRKES